MRHSPHRPTRALLLCAAIICASTSGVWAASTSSVSISDSVATSVGSASTSLQGSSNSSSGRAKVAEGDYKIIAVTAALADGGDGGGNPAMLRLTLQAQASDGEGHAPPLFLRLPQAAWAGSGLASGHTITARHRPYGLEFAQARSGQAFFLVLDDEWQRELHSRPVLL